MSGPADLEDQWRRATERWSPAIALSLPKPIVDDDAIAYIDLATRQTHVNFHRLALMGVIDHLGCVLAHEVGHHIRYPHTLNEARRMIRFLREVARDLLWDGKGAVEASKHDWLLNLFFDLLINDDLVDEHEAAFVAIFGAMQGEWGLAFSFYVGIFEELWALPRLAILTKEQDDALAEVDPEWRSRAATTGEFVRGHPENRPLQLVRFIAAIRPFVLTDRERGTEGGEAFERRPWDGAPLSPDDIGDLLRARPDEEGARRWLREHGGKPQVIPGGGDPLIRAKLELEGLAPPSTVALAAYRREADRARLDVPASLEPGEPFVPGPHTSWDLGDDLESVDWIGSMVRSGARPIPSVTTLARTFLPDDPRPGDRELPWVEMYVDSSGSMPNPVESYSHQIEAGFILVRAATRAGGRVRIIQYSSMGQQMVMESFVRSAGPAELALLEFIGGGTDFPWDLLASSVKKYRRLARVRRVVISDSDFIHNFANPTPALNAAAIVREAADAGGFTGLLNLSAGLEKPLVDAGMDVVIVRDWKDVGQAARALADALFRTKEKTRRTG